MSSEVIRWLAELRNKRDDADVTLNCHGEVIMAHSLFLTMRYFLHFENTLLRFTFQV